MLDMSTILSALWTAYHGTCWQCEMIRVLEVGSGNETIESPLLKCTNLVIDRASDTVYVGRHLEL